MAQIDVSYDHPLHTGRVTGGGLSTAGNAGVSVTFAAFTAMKALAAQITVRTAGTSATTGHVAIVNKVSGTTTTALATATLGTSAIGTTTRVELSATALAAGDVLVCKNGTDATGVYAVAYEAQITPGASVTKPV